jgi:hypothetical protein
MSLQLIRAPALLDNYSCPILFVKRQVQIFRDGMSRPPNAALRL